jgi:hypothetical protein
VRRTGLNCEVHDRLIDFGTTHRSSKGEAIAWVRQSADAASEDIYHRFAAVLATQAKTTVVDDLVLPELNAAQIPRPPTAEKLSAAARRTIAPGQLHTLVRNATLREGCVN